MAQLDTSVVTREEEIQVLVRLGLTCNQARVYLALARSGASTARTISRASKVTREDVYRILPKLQEVGLVEKTIEKPSIYAAVPLQDAFRFLIKSREQITSELKTETKEIIRNFDNNIRTSLEEEEHEFVLIPREAAVVKRKSIIDDAKERIDFITPSEEFTQSNASYATNLRNALKRNVEIRVIVGKPEDEKSWPKPTQTWAEKHHLFKTRWIPSTPKARLMLIDGKKVLFAKSATTSSEEGPFLWSINQSLASVVQDYFEMMWLTSSSIKTNSTNHKRKV